MNLIATTSDERPSQIASSCIGGFPDDVKVWKGMPDPGKIFVSDKRASSGSLCLPLGLDCSSYVASVAFPRTQGFRPDAELIARTYGQLVALAVEAGCGRLTLVPPKAAEHVLPCLVEALVRQDMAGAGTLELNLSAFPENIRRQAERVAQGKSLARQITETTPDLPVFELAELAAHRLETAGLKVEAVSAKAISEEYPLLSAVAAATSANPDRRPSVLRIQLGSPCARRALFCAGKGVVMDTGGLDLKPAGQFGMSRDKGGAGSLSGFLLAAAGAIPEDLFIRAELAFTWNGVGGNAITPDHCLTSASGLRVQVGNTDAEGRLLLSDVVASLLSARRAASAQSADFIALATLTGHAGRAFGKRSVLVGDDTAQQRGLDRMLFDAASRMGERSAVSPLCPEDWDVMRTARPGIDLVAATPANSVATPRGHQYPCAVIKKLSGWFSKPVPEADCFLLADIAGANTRSDVAGQRAGAPMVGALAAHYLFTEEAAA